MARVLKGLGEYSEIITCLCLDYSDNRFFKREIMVDFFDAIIAALASDKGNIDKLTKLFKQSMNWWSLIKKVYREHSSNIYILDKKLQVKKIIPNGIPSEEITMLVKRYL